MRPDLDPAQLSPDDRAREVAAILARGVLRLRDRAALGPTSAAQKAQQEVSDSLANGLAVGAEKSVTVHAD